MSVSFRTTAKTTAYWVATVLALPALLSYAVRRVLFGPDRALEGSSQALSLLPGLPGQYIRRAFYARVLDHCDPSVTIEFGVLFSKAGARLDERVYVGPRCHIGLVHLERDVLLAPAVHIPSGRSTHGTDDPDTPIREQAGTRTRVRIGHGTWIGSGAVVMADVGADTVVGAGAVVVRPVGDRVLCAGNPARVIRSREGSAPTGAGEARP